MDLAEDVLFLAQSADASCYHRIDAAGARARLRLGRARLAAAADDRSAAARSRFDEGGPDLGALPRSSSCRRRRRRAGSTLIPRAAGGRDEGRVRRRLPPARDRDRPEDVLTLIETLLAHVRRRDLRDARTSPSATRGSTRGRSSARTASTCARYALTQPAARHGEHRLGRDDACSSRRCCPGSRRSPAMMRVRDVTNFVSIGQRCGDAVAAMGAVAPERCLAIPGVLPEQCPAAMSIFDIAFDPAGHAAVAARAQPAALAGVERLGHPVRRRPAHLPGHRGRRDGLPRRRPDRDRAHDPAASSTTRCCAPRSAARARRDVEERYTMEAVAPQWVRALEQVAGVKVGWLADSFEVAGRRRAHAGGVPRRGAGGRRGRRGAARRGSSGSPAATCVCVHNCVTYPGRETIAALEGKPVLRYWHDLARDGRRRPIRRSTAGRPSTRRASSPRRCTATASRTASTGESHLIPPAIDLARFRAQGTRKRARRLLARLGDARRQGAAPGVRVGGGERAGRLLGRAAVRAAAVAAHRRQGPGPAAVRARDPRALRALRLPADDDRAVRPRRGRGLGRGLRADRQPQRRRAALDRAARTALETAAADFWRLVGELEARA